MKDEWIYWFISNVIPLTGTVEAQDRKYSFKNIHISKVPFHIDLKNYIYSLSTITENSEYEVYHIHKWEQGCFFNEHADFNFNRKWAYVVELQSSKCGTSLEVNNKPKKECLFDSYTLHRVPIIKQGTRISLTVFGTPYKTPI